MKRVLQSILVLVISLFGILNVNAKTESELISYMSQTFNIAGSEFKLSEGDLLRLERYLNEYDISSDNIDKIIVEVDNIVELLNNCGVSNPTKLNKENAKKLFNMAQNAAKLAGASLTYDATNKVISIYRDAKLFDVVPINQYKLAQTGGNNTIYYVISGLFLISGITILYRKFHKHV